MANYKRVVIVDPQLKDRKGHNIRYATGIASQLQLPATVLSHRDFVEEGKADGDANLKVVPSLTFDQYNNSAFKDSYRELLFDRLGRYKNIITRRLKEPNAIWEKHSPLDQLFGFGVLLLNILLFIPALIRQLFWLIRGKGSSAHTDHTALELKAAFDKVNLNQDDLLIFQTMMWPTFESLLELRIQADKHYGCDALFLVHEDWQIYGLGYIRFTPAHFARRVLEALPFRRSKVLSTNAPLSDYCEKWCDYRPSVFREIDHPVTPPEKAAGGNVSRILVPGVYRGDKNFEGLSQLLEQVAAAHSGLTFSLHRSVASRVPVVAGNDNSVQIYEDVEGAQAWLDFLSGFDLVLLPYGEAYTHRISGIIHEARLLNIPVICSSDIADASLIRHRECLYGDKGQGIAEAVGFCRQAAPDTRFFTADYPPGIEECIDTEAGWIAWQDKPVAVQIKPAWTRCGTTVVLDAQLDYLVEKGFFVVELYIKGEPWNRQPEQVEFMWQVMRGGRENSGGMAVRVLLKEVKLLPLLDYVKQVIRRRIPAFFKRENIHNAWCTPDKALLNFFHKHKPQLALVNHMFNADFAFKYIPAEQFVCESHDIQINQLLMRRPELQANYHNELQYEMDLLAKFDGVVNLNRGEHQQIAANIGSKALFIRPPIIKRELANPYPSLKALLRAQSKTKGLDKIPERLNLLIIADGHPANVMSVAQFLQDVFVKLPKGITLGIVGTVVGHLQLSDELWHHKNIYYLGFLDSLANIQAFADLQILPDIAGEGIPIKTDETIANDMPFVATSHALRGFSAGELQAAGISAFDEAEATIRAIEEMLENETIRNNLVQRAQHLRAANNIEQYYKNWDLMLEQKTAD